MTAQDFLDELLRITQLVRKNMIASQSRALLDHASYEVYGRNMTDDEAEKILSEMFPYIFGEGSIMHPILRIDGRGRSYPITGSEIYNLMLIVTRMEKSGSLKQAWITFSPWSNFPEPAPMLALQIGDALNAQLDTMFLPKKQTVLW